MGKRKERGFIRAPGAVPCYEGRNSRFQSTGHVAESEWRAPSKRFYIEDDFRCSGAGRLRQRIHDSSAGRRDQHGHATGRWLGNEAAAISEGGRRGGAGNRRFRGIASANCGLPMKEDSGPAEASKQVLKRS